MEYWEFLIQRQGDRGWRPIKTGNLQLMEGKYRIVANSHLLDTQIQTRVTHQTPDLTAPQRRSQSCNQTTNSRGLLAIIPFTHLHSGIWQFVCSGMSGTQTWHQILKLRVLPRAPVHAPNSTNSPQLEALAARTAIDRSDDLATPTAPMVPISMLGEQENWADGLDRLLEQLERDSLQVQNQQPVAHQELLGTIQLDRIVEPPSQLISLNRSTFSGIVPGNRLMINGACNLRLLNPNLVQTVKIEKLSICLRHPQTSEIITSIEQPLPPNLDKFAFSGQLKLPTEPKISLLLGEVNLYDKHHIQLGSSGFTVTLNLNPLHESELSLLRLFDLDPDTPAAMTQITQELQIEPLTIGQHSSSRHANTNPPKIPLSSQYPPVPLAYKRESVFTHPDIKPVPSSIDRTSSPEGVRKIAHTLTDITGNLEIDFVPAVVGVASPRHQNLEIVIDD